MADILNINTLRHFLLQDKGTFDLRDEKGMELEWCEGGLVSSLNQQWNRSWLSITPKGQLVSNGRDVLIENMQSCATQLLPTMSPPLISITPYNDAKRRLYLKTGEQDEDEEYKFDELLANLLVWSNLKPAGLSKKWAFNKSIVEDDKFYGNEILVCRFKVYGPIPSKSKGLKIVDGPRVPINNASLATGNGSSSSSSSAAATGATKNEGWFYAMGHLKPNGVLDLLLESDGSLLYSLNISILFTSEIRQIDHSIFQNSNILYLGLIQELRALNSIKSTEFQLDQTKDFVIPPSNTNTTSSSKHDLQIYLSTSRILLEFPLHIDLEDWFVTLSSFTKREYLGVSTRKARQLRSLQKVQLDILEAKFDDPQLYHKKQLYCELNLWSSLWFRTSVVECYKNNPFWRETFNFELPVSTNYFQVVIKESSHKEDEYSVDDRTVGTVYITPDMLGADEPVDKLTIYDHETNSAIGKVFLNLVQHQHYILPLEEYRIFEKMIVAVPFDQLIEFFKPLTSTLDKLETISVMLVDVFQTLGRENEWFSALMNHELLPVDSLIRNNRMKGTVSSKTTNVFNTLFRGNSMLTKSLEKFNFRVGQEYLEKTIGDFVNEISEEKLDCEIDPRLVEADDPQRKAQIVEDHCASLLHYVEKLWCLIFKTSNDLPAPIKTQLTKFRLKIEHSVEPTDTVTPLNCLTLFIFLRFFCPAILNPKLFYLTKNHQSGDVQRTLTLVAKILLNLATRQKFVEHKEPYLMVFNDFIEQHEPEVFEYFDKLTGRKLDFEPKVLELSDDVTRPSLNIPNEILEELPTNPYLIDKYLRIVELITLLSRTPQTSADGAKGERTYSSDSNEEQLYKIHTLESEENGDDELTRDKLFLELETYNAPGENAQNQDILLQTDTFLKNLLKSSSDDFDDLVKSNLKLQDLQSQSQLILAKTQKLLNTLKRPETVVRHLSASSSNLSAIASENQAGDNTLISLAASSAWVAFVDEVLESAIVDLNTKQILFLNHLNVNLVKRRIDPAKYKFLAAGGFKFKIVTKNLPLTSSDGGILRSSSMNTLKIGENSKNPFKRLFGKKSLRND